MSVRIIGLDELGNALKEMGQRIDDYDFILKSLHRSAQQYAHVDTGYMKGSGKQGSDYIEFMAPYSGYEADRGGSHDFGQRAVDTWNPQAYLDYIVEPF